MNEPTGGEVAHQWLSYLTVERGKSPNTIASYRRDLRRYLEFVGDRRLSMLSAPDLDAFLQSLGREGQAVSSCLLYTSPSPRDVEESRMPSSA